MSVQWIEGEPPARSSSIRTERQPIRAMLRANPDQWAVVKRFAIAEAGREKAATRAGAWAQSLSRGPAGKGIEALSRRVGDEVLVYARAVTP